MWVYAVVYIRGRSADVLQVRMYPNILLRNRGTVGNWLSVPVYPYGVRPYAHPYVRGTWVFLGVVSIPFVKDFCGSDSGGICSCFKPGNTAVFGTGFLTSRCGTGIWKFAPLQSSQGRSELIGFCIDILFHHHIVLNTSSYIIYINLCVGIEPGAGILPFNKNI